MAQRSGQTAPSGGYGIWGMNEVHRSIPEHKSLETTLERKFKNSFFAILPGRRLFFLFLPQAVRIAKTCQLALMLWIRAGAELLRSDDAML